MVESYNNRVQKFLVDMNEKPMQVRKYEAFHLDFREIDSEKFLGPKVISPNRWLSERNRIEETIEKNQILFCEASDDKNKEFKLRVRE
mmetsp:Transcript_32837/g.32065  ORF Transcript_32837/g.32065 Transcript_32837/m.32065 type:complete len:88 (+) Transcript_32837:104-367(+)|eukprot:CAMPEP_0170546850 /NCGR_PEP_ID=MMETSP0211-20121228/5198_1 /TAXON_ID=311385 /ORGANISM="Pseudokeronopsis sp., Strain OXSARD2" /LENGTH=87 /DNA_ID=CAMNT_0010851527 /DNA_START=11 /DNA_END=274 /DNA_ORIENTATION=-